MIDAKTIHFQCQVCHLQFVADTIKAGVEFGHQHMVDAHGAGTKVTNCNVCQRHFEDSPDASMMQRVEAHMRQEHPDWRYE